MHDASASQLRSIETALANPAARARMADSGSEPLTGSSVEFANLVAEEIEPDGV
jgi:hypothetical protein